MAPPRRRRTSSEVLDADITRLERAGRSKGQSGRAQGRRAAAKFVPDPQAIKQLLEGSDGPVAEMLLTRSIQVQRQAKRACPVDTGRLRSSIQYRIDRDNRGLKAEVGTNVEYAPYVELGTSQQPARPFLRPALQAVFRFASRGRIGDITPDPGSPA